MALPWAGGPGLTADWGPIVSAIRMLYGFESKRDHDLSPHSCEKWTKESMKGMPPRVGGRCLRCARGSRLAGSLLARDVVGASSACTNEFHETRGGRTRTQPQRHRPQRTTGHSAPHIGVRRQARASQLEERAALEEPPRRTLTRAHAASARGVQAAAQHRNPGWVLFRSSGGFRLRWVSKSDAPLATGWVGSSALRSHLQPPATLLVTCA